MKCPGVDDFDTSDLLGGSKPRNQQYKTRREPPSRLHSSPSYTRPSRIFGGTVTTVEKDTLNGYHVQINKYEQGEKPYQVFISKPDYSDSVTGSFATEIEIFQFIADNAH